MTTIDFITDLFCCVDDTLTQDNINHKHTQAKLYPSEVITVYRFGILDITIRSLSPILSENIHGVLGHLTHISLWNGVRRYH